METGTTEAVSETGGASGPVLGVPASIVVAPDEPPEDEPAPLELPATPLDPPDDPDGPPELLLPDAGPAPPELLEVEPAAPAPLDPEPAAPELPDPEPVAPELLEPEAEAPELPDSDPAAPELPAPPEPPFSAELGPGWETAVFGLEQPATRRKMAPTVPKRALRRCRASVTHATMKPIRSSVRTRMNASGRDKLSAH